MSGTGQDTPVGVEQKPAARSVEDRKLAERLVSEAIEKGLDLIESQPHGCPLPRSYDELRTMPSP